VVEYIIGYIEIFCQFFKNFKLLDSNFAKRQESRSGLQLEFPHLPLEYDPSGWLVKYGINIFIGGIICY
jgi:hypothetical protein